jgi:glycerol-3-phosphate acyltransferase PlsX
MSSSSHDTLDMLRERQDLSSLVGVEELRSGRADAFVSIGHTGATVGASAFGLGRVRGMGRPGLAVELPTAHGPVILLDCGAAPHATAEDLVRFAAVGASYARIVGIDSPRIGLLSIGGERGKGDHLRKQTDIRLAEEFPAQYVGAVEGHHLMAEGRADVIVVDGFTGNVALKSMEGALRWSVGAMGIAYGSIGPAREVLRSTHLLSGASLLGVDGNIVVGHGASRADEINGCIRRAAMLHEGSIVESVRASVSGLPELNARGELA